MKLSEIKACIAFQVVYSLYLVLTNPIPTNPKKAKALKSKRKACF